METLQSELFKPIVASEDERAILDLLRAGSMLATEITRQFVAECSDYLGMKYSLGHSRGTAGLLGAVT